MDNNISLFIKLETVSLLYAFSSPYFLAFHFEVNSFQNISLLIIANVVAFIGAVGIAVPASLPRRSLGIQSPTQTALMEKEIGDLKEEIYRLREKVWEIEGPQSPLLQGTKFQFRVG